ncbi:SusC/RagA family TonB-linked outer membrane protein [uncultured Salegentibacter sp.]|uniref:SusC/RagA family TonB-linked outer membrane protein n=1 Tax=uncultured Salegentibacter sp. TaxID=259320 RepID=UPI002596D745|nr:SusC/RagA family TonB-linked outer membrane protein [uncultured Salegentibacter sp.]
MRNIYILAFLLFFSFSKTNGQEASKVITGIVLDSETNEPLPGVNVYLKGTAIGVITDFEGEFTLKVPSENSTLVIQFLGYESQELSVEGRENFQISLQSTLSQLEDVVIVGYGKQSREFITSAVSKVDTELIESTPSINAVQALEGRVAGLSIQVNSGQPGEDATVFLRGGSSPDPNSGDAPLYIIDGVMRSGLGGLNPDDIESLQVLKDAAATSIYGARGANGIILVTTKSGAGVEGSNIQLRYNFGIEELRENYPWTSAEEYIQLSREAAERGGNLPPGSRLDGEIFGYSAQVGYDRGEYGFMKNTLTYLDYLISVEGQAYVANLIENEGFSTMMDPATGRTLIFKDNNYNEMMFDPALSHEVDLAFTGGSEMGNYNVSLGYVNQEGVLIGTEGDNFSFLSNGEYNVKENFKVDAGVSFNLDDWTSVSSSNNELNRSPKLPHTYRLYNDDGTPALGESTSSPRNRLHEIYYTDKDRKIMRMTYRLGADWEILDGLSFRPSGSYYREEWMYESFQRASPDIPGREMRKEQYNDDQLMLNALLNYDKSLGEHNFDLLGGVNYTLEIRDDLSGNGGNAPTDLISTINASETERERAYSYRNDTKLMSYFGRLNYNFNTKYLLSASFRVDGSSRFAENKKWGFFPAFSAGWNVHNEDFWTLDFFNRLKIRGSWGQAGNLAGLRLQDTQGQFATTIYNGQGGVVNNILPNNNLTWETTTTFDVGVDMGFFNNRLDLFVDYYHKLTSDRIISRPLPQQTGFGSIKENYGSLLNEGIEVEFGGDVLRNNDFIWRTDFAFAYNRTTIEELPDNGRAKNRINGGIIYAPTSADPNAEMEVGGLAEGERVGGLWAYDLIGVYATDEAAQNGPVDLFKRNTPQGGDAIWRDVNGDNIIDEKDLVFVGWKYPSIRGGMVNTLSWKGLSVRVAVDYALGHSIANEPLIRSMSNARNNVMTMDEALGDNVWMEQGDEGMTYPRYDIFSDWDSGARNYLRDLGANGSLGTSGGGGHNSAFYRDGDYLAFREVAVSYSLPQNALSLGMSALSVSLSAHNLGYLTAYDGLTPEIFDGLDDGVYPRPRRIIVGLTASF